MSVRRIWQRQTRPAAIRDSRHGPWLARRVFPAHCPAANGLTQAITLGDPVVMPPSLLQKYQ